MPGLHKRIWRSVVREPLRPRNDRERRAVVFRHLFLHFRPTTLPQRTLRYTHTFGLGGMSLVLFLMLVATGVLLMFVYEPGTSTAYGSVQRLRGEILFGGLVRNVHYWSANALLVVAFLHLLRVFFTGGFHGSRQFNWVIGLSLFACIVASNLTGYLLPWDQLSYWATTIVTGMIGYVPWVGGSLQGLVRGGPVIGPATLVIFYTIHTTLMPVLLVALMAWHFWRVRKSRGVVIPRGSGEPLEERPRSVLALPHLFIRELSVGLILVACIMALSVAFDAPLGEAANPGMSPNPARAPWYFAGFQELLLHFHPLFSVVLIPLAGAVALALIPYVRYDGDTAGVFMVSRFGRRSAAWAAVAAVLVTPLWVAASELWLGADGWIPGSSPVVGAGAVPFAGLVLALAGGFLLLRRRARATREEAVQALFVFVVVSFVVLTAVSVWFRGEGMALTLPWSN